VLPGGRNSGQKAQNGPIKNGYWKNLRPNFIKSERKGAKENFEKKYIILELCTGRETLSGPGNMIDFVQTFLACLIFITCMRYRELGYTKTSFYIEK
jgi:hypothetical protein